MPAQDNGKPVKRSISERALELLWGLRGEASLKLDTDASLTEIIRYVHTRILAEHAKPLPPGLLADRLRCPSRREALQRSDLTILRSYMGDASVAFSKTASTSETAEYMVECLLACRQETKRRKSQAAVKG